MIATILIYVLMGWLTAGLVGLIRELVGDPLRPWTVVGVCVFWPIIVAALFARALEVSK